MWAQAMDNSAVGYTFATGLALGNPSTRKTGIQMASFGVRSTANFWRAAVWGRGPGFLGTTLVRGGTMTARAAAVQSTAAVLGPLAVGYGISYGIGAAMDYDDATDDYLDFITGDVSPKQWWDSVTLSSMR